jgi:hypothetical protein
MRIGSTPPEGVPRPPESGKAIFAFWVVLVLFAIFGHFLGVKEAAADLKFCRPGIGILDSRLNLMPVFYWAIAGSFWIYFVLWTIWVVTRWPPWITRNPTSFSREAWSGTKAWAEAQHHLFAVLTNPNAPTGQRLRFLAHLVFGVWTVGGGLLLILLIASCDHCPSHPLGNCSAVAGAPGGGVGVVVLYYDLRIKFRRRIGG